MLMKTNRRDVIKSMAALPLLRFPGADPDLILYNALVYTAQPGNPKATAIAVRDGRILAVGGDRDILALAGKRTRRTDLGRRRGRGRSPSRRETPRPARTTAQRVRGGSRRVKLSWMSFSWARIIAGLNGCQATKY